MGNSVTNGYRNRIDKADLRFDELIDYGYDDGKEYLIPKFVIKEVLDDVESDVSELVNLLEDIEGLSEIDVVKSKLKELSYKLY